MIKENYIAPKNIKYTIEAINLRIVQMPDERKNEGIKLDMYISEKNILDQH